VSTNRRACLSLVVMVVPLMRSIGGNNDGVYTLHMFPLTPRALGLAFVNVRGNGS
jgi:hypothetical protein